MLDEYMKSLSKIQKLSRKEEAALWQAYKMEGKVSARQKLIEQYQLLVVREAVKYPIQESLVLDLIQEGTVGLWKPLKNTILPRELLFPFMPSTVSGEE